jgi:hypothetical protein
MAMPARSWAEIDPDSRRLLDEQYLRELSTYFEPGIDEAAIQAYLEYRHERPDAGITTFEEGQIRRLLHRGAHPELVPDPVEQEDHLDALERYGASHWHFTNTQTYAMILFVLIVGAVLTWLLAML